MLGAVVSMLARYGFTIILIDYVLSFGKGDDVFFEQSFILVGVSFGSVVCCRGGAL